MRNPPELQGALVEIDGKTLELLQTRARLERSLLYDALRFAMKERMKSVYLVRFIRK